MAEYGCFDLSPCSTGFPFHHTDLQSLPGLTRVDIALRSSQGRGRRQQANNRFRPNLKCGQAGYGADIVLKRGVRQVAQIAEIRTIY